MIGLGEGRMRYTQFTNPTGGILDDLMVTRLPATSGTDDRLFLVVNAACKEADEAHLRQHIKTARLTPMPERALLAVQGPGAGKLVAELLPEVTALTFMQGAQMTWQGHDLIVTRSGYTGEDGFEISLPAEAAETFAEALVASGVVPAGLGARDTLRLEAGLCLYGHDMDETITPIEADLTWSIGKRRRLEGGFRGDTRILEQLSQGVTRKRVGLRPEGRAPIREGADVLDAQGQKVGHITSGTFSPTLQTPIVMGYVPAALAQAGTRLTLEQRGRTVEAHVVTLPFVPHRYQR
jgi:aminomethyltransferase